MICQLERDRSSVPGKKNSSYEVLSAFCMCAENEDGYGEKQREKRKLNEEDPKRTE